MAAHQPRHVQAESGITSEEEALDALRVGAQLNGLGEHPDGGPVVPQPLLHLCQHPDGMHPGAVGVIQRQGLAKGCFCLCHMPKLQIQKPTSAILLLVTMLAMPWWRW